MSRFFHLIFSLSLLAIITFNVTAWAEGGTTVQGGHSGGWYNLNQSGHGVFAEILDDPSSPTGKRMVLAWYAFFEGRQVWILAVGNVVPDGEGQTAVMTAWIYEGNGFPPDYNPDLTNEIVWGEIRMYFIGCDEAVIEWDSIIEGFGSGSLEVQRLTTISGTTCDPDPGGQPPDDHGDSWETATAFQQRLTYNDFFEGVHENRDDVDVFIFTLADNQTLAIFTLGPSDTVGTLYRIENNRETEIATDDDSGIIRNFFIEEDLQSGTYSIHVAPTELGIYGGYRIYIQTN
jgi:hypothetical protein